MNKKETMLKKSERIIEELPNILKQEWISLKNLGIKIPHSEILKEYRLIPWWERLFMTSKRKKLEKSKITLKKIME